MNDKYFDAILNIETTQDRDFSKYVDYHRYEPTPYSVLEFLAQHIELQPDDRIVDFGCGKGRTLFYLYHVYGMFATGIEMDDKLFKALQNNLERFVKRKPQSKRKLFLYNILAEKYSISRLDNKFYFFNPFSGRIFKIVVSNILHSLNEYGRKADILLYYPHPEYIEFLEDRTPFQLKKELKIPGSFEQNENERILIYTI